MRKTTLAIMLIAVLAIAGCTQAEQQEAADILTADEPTMEQAEQTLDALSEADDSEEQEGQEEEELNEENAAEEATYSAAVYTDSQAALNEPGPKVVYFHATWCPTCRALEERVQSSLSEFPDGTKIVKVDYDTATELKTQYGVKVQTSLVVLDAEGNQVGDILVNPSNAQIIEAVNQTL